MIPVLFLIFIQSSEQEGYALNTNVFQGSNICQETDDDGINFIDRYSPNFFAPQLANTVRRMTKYTGMGSVTMQSTAEFAINADGTPLSGKGEVYARGTDSAIDSDDQMWEIYVQNVGDYKGITVDLRVRNLSPHRQKNGNLQNTEADDELLEISFHVAQIAPLTWSDTDSHMPDPHYPLAAGETDPVPRNRNYNGALIQFEFLDQATGKAVEDPDADATPNTATYNDGTTVGNMEYVLLTVADFDTGSSGLKQNGVQWHEVPTFDATVTDGTTPDLTKELGQGRVPSRVPIASEQECAMTLGGIWEPHAIFVDRDQLPNSGYLNDDKARQMDVVEDPLIDLRGVASPSNDRTMRFCSLRPGIGQDNPKDSFEGREMKWYPSSSPTTSYLEQCANRGTSEPEDFKSFAEDGFDYHKTKSGDPSKCQSRSMPETIKNWMNQYDWVDPSGGVADRNHVPIASPLYGCGINESDWGTVNDVNDVGLAADTTLNYGGNQGGCSEVISKRMVQFVWSGQSVVRLQMAQGDNVENLTPSSGRNFVFGSSMLDGIFASCDKPTPPPSPPPPSPPPPSPPSPSPPPPSPPPPSWFCGSWFC